MNTDTSITCFGEFRLDRTNRQLHRGGEVVELGSRYFDALVLLLDQRGNLVTKDAFMEAVWRGIPVTDEALTQCIRALRKALGDDAASPQFIQTVPKHGYRFIAAVDDGKLPASGQVDLPMRIAGACTLAGLAAGTLAGLVYGLWTGTGGAGQVLILAAMIGAFGLLAGSGLGLGLAAALSWRGKADASLVAGGAMSGLVIGAAGSLLGREGIGLLTGQSLGAVTGPLEGALIGCATGIVAWLALSGRSRGPVVMSALASAAIAGGTIHLAGGAMLAESLWSVQTGLGNTQLAMERLGVLTGADTFSAMAQGMASIAESMVFVLAMAAALLAARR